MKNNKNLISIVKSFYLRENINFNNIKLSSLVKDTLQEIIEMEEFDDAEDYCNNHEDLNFIGQGRESIVYSDMDSGVMIKLNDMHDKSAWKKYMALDFFAKTEIYDTEFGGVVILQEPLTLDPDGFKKNNIKSQLENAIKAAGLKYDPSEISDANAGKTKDGRWKLFDIPIE